MLTSPCVASRLQDNVSFLKSKLTMILINKSVINGIR
jgi:hypothetical protein